MLGPGDSLTVMATRFRAWVTVVALAALLAGGCTSGESSSSGGTSNLPDGLGAVKDVGSSRIRFAWADMGQLRKLTGLTSASAAAHKRGDPKWSRLLDVGVDTELEPQLTQATGIDAYKASRAISIGVTPNKATRLDGMVGAAVTKKMNALGATQQKAFGRTFLVLAGECLLIVEGQERRLTAWDFFHCPGGTEHIIVGAGDEPAIVVAVGGRGRGVGGGVVYTVSDLAARHGASVERETTNPAEAYKRVHADLPRSRWVEYRPGWLPALG